ncbi:MAG: aldo/keto reductase [Acidobacteriota bacterium]|nr:aldo/keto reductase [Acidobacteriota bacterium]
MRLEPFGPLPRLVPVIGQGTWNIEKTTSAEVVKTLRRGLDLGMTHIDTAEMYGSGESEELVGKAIAGRREEVFLVSKVLPGNATEKGTVAACEKSLARLGTDRLDCFLLHWRGRHPLEGTIAAFEQLRQQGKITSWGVSNFDVSDLEDAERLAPKGHVVCNQVLYHLKERAIEHAVLPWCAAHGVAVVAYSPFGSGDFPRPGSAGGRVLQRIADSRGVTTRQIALAFVTRLPGVFTIPKAAGADHVSENAAAGDLKLTPAEIALLDAAFPLGRPKSLPMI